MNKIGKHLCELTKAFAFSFAVLEFTFMLSFVALIGLVYGDNIRGYVPAGLSGMQVVIMTAIGLLFLFRSIARRRSTSVAPYLVGLVIALPVTVLAFSFCDILMFRRIGYSLLNDVVLHSVGAALCLAAATLLYISWFDRKTDNKAMHVIAAERGKT